MIDSDLTLRGPPSHPRSSVTTRCCPSSQRRTTPGRQPVKSWGVTQRPWRKRKLRCARRQEQLLHPAPPRPELLFLGFRPFERGKEQPGCGRCDGLIVTGVPVDSESFWCYCCPWKC